MEVAYIGVPFKIDGFTPLKGAYTDYPYTWFNTLTQEINYGNTTVSGQDIMVETEEQFYLAINLVKLGITDIETLQQLLGINSCPPLTVSNLPLS